MPKHTSSPRLCSAIDRASRPATLVLSIAVYMLFPLFVFPHSAADMQHLPLDLKLAYTPAEAYGLLDSLGPAGRQHYMLGTTVLDVVYAITYTIMFSIWLTLLWRGRTRHLCAWSLSPVAVFALDMLENTGIALMLANYPAQYPSLALVSSAFTSCKWLLAGVLILTTLTLSVWRFGSWLFRPGKQR